SAVVTQTRVVRRFCHRQWLNGINTQACQGGKFAHYIQKIAILISARDQECPDMKLVDHQIVEVRRSEPRIVPGEQRRIAQRTIALREYRRKRKFPGARVGFVSLAAETIHIEEVLVSLLQAGNEGCPVITSNF